MFDKHCSGPSLHPDSPGLGDDDEIGPNFADSVGMVFDDDNPDDVMGVRGARLTELLCSFEAKECVCVLSLIFSLLELKPLDPTFLSGIELLDVPDKFCGTARSVP